MCYIYFAGKVVHHQSKHKTGLELLVNDGSYKFRMFGSYIEQQLIRRIQCSFLSFFFYFSVVWRDQTGRLSSLPYIRPSQPTIPQLNLERNRINQCLSSHNNHTATFTETSLGWNDILKTIRIRKIISTNCFL